MAVDCLVDTNVLVRLLVPADPLAHAASEAVRLRRVAGDHLLVASQNIVEFWSVATRPKSANGLGMGTATAGEAVARFESFFSIVHETADVYPVWRDLVLSLDVSGRQVHDARLAALMLATGVSHILTFNGDDFARYPGLTVLDPFEVVAPQSR